MRLPVIVRAIIAGLAVASAGTVPWALLSVANGRFLVSVPWAIVPASLWLWLLWRYLGGAGRPTSTSSLRRNALRDVVPPARDGVRRRRRRGGNGFPRLHAAPHRAPSWTGRRDSPQWRGVRFRPHGAPPRRGLRNAAVL